MTHPEDDEDVDSGWDMGELSSSSTPAPPAPAAASAAPLSPPVTVEVAPVAKAAEVAKPTPLAKPTLSRPPSAKAAEGVKPTLAKPTLARPLASKAAEVAKPALGAALAAPKAPEVAKSTPFTRPTAPNVAAVAQPEPPPEVAADPVEVALDTLDAPAAPSAEDASESAEEAVDLNKTMEAPVAAAALTSKLLELSKRVDAALGVDVEPTSAAPTVRRDVPEVPKTLAERIAARLLEPDVDIGEKNTPAGGVEISALGDVDDDPVPATRRASDDELREVKNRAGIAPALRLGGAKGARRSTTPLHTDAVTKAKQLDARIHSRPTPPARPPITPLPPANTAIRFGSEAPNLTRSRATAATKVNFAAVKLADSTREGDPGGSAPALDLHLPDDLSGLDATAAEVAKPPAPSSANKTRELSFELDDLPVEEMIESARPSTRPPPPPASPQPAAPAKMTGLAKPGGAERPAAKSLGLSAPKPEAAPSKAAASGLARTSALGAGPSTPLRAPSLKTGGIPRPAPAASSSAPTPVPPAPQKTPPAPAVEIGSGEAELAADEVAALSDELSFDGLLDSVDGGAAAAVAGGLSLELDEPGAVSRVAPEVAPARVVFEEDPAVAPIRVRFEKGDYFGAMVRAESVLEQDPDNEQVKSYLESARDLVAQMYKEKLGSGEQVLRLAMVPSEIQNLALDHRAGFLISLVDGIATVDEILDMSGMPEIDVLRLLYEMREQGVVSVDSMAPT